MENKGICQDRISVIVSQALSKQGWTIMGSIVACLSQNSISLSSAINDILNTLNGSTWMRNREFYFGMW